MLGYKRLIPTEKRILLHLLDYRGSVHKYDVPDALTQKGIAQAVVANRDYVSGLTKKLVNKGYVQKYTGRVKHGKRIQKYFLLTGKGKRHTKKLKNKLSNLQIALKQVDGTSKMMRLKDMIPYLDKEEICPDITDLDVYNIASSDNTLDIENLKNFKKMQFFDFSPEAPIVVHFYGRKREIALLESWVEDKKGHNIIFINGMAGIGKTTLAAKFIEKYRGSKHLFWHNFRDQDTLRGVLFKLAKFLSRLGNNHLKMHLRTHRSVDCSEVSTILGESIGVVDAVVVFDNFHKSNDLIREFFGYILGILSSPSNTKVLILSRGFVPFYDWRDVFKREIVGELELEGLDFKSSKRLLREKGIDKSRFKEIYESTGGNPLFLEIFNSKDDLERYMHDEIFLKLEEDERKILEIISIHRFPVLEDTLAARDEIDLEKLYYLTQKSLVKKNAHYRYFLHEIIKQFFYRKLSPSEKRKHHLLAAQWSENRNEALDLMEAIYHYQEASEYKKASQLAIDRSALILDGGYATEFLTLLERFDEVNVEPSVLLEILMLKGKACNVCGECKKALHCFTQSADIAAITDDYNLRVKAICESGHILEEQNQFDRAMDCFKKSLDVSKEADYFQGIGMAYRGIGRIHWRNSEHEEAIANFRKSLEISEKFGFSELAASTYIDLGNVYDERYETKKAIECYNKSLDILKKVKNTSENVRVYLNLAATYRHVEEFNKAIDCYTESLALAKDIREVKWIGYDYAGISYCLAKTDKFEKARECARKAEDIALKIDSENIMFDIYQTNSLICKAEGHWDDAIANFKKSMGIAEKLSASYQLSDLHFELGLLYEEVGDTKNAKKHFDVAAGLYDRLGIGKAELVKGKLSILQ